MKERFEDFTISMIKAGKLIQKIKNIEMSDYQLKAIHAMILYNLNEHPNGLTNTDLVKCIQEDKAAISRALKDLKNKNMIYYEQTDKLYHAKIFLTEEGNAVARQLGEKAIRAVQAGGNGLNQEQREIFYQSLHQIMKNLEEYYQQLQLQENQDKK